MVPYPVASAPAGMVELLDEATALIDSSAANGIPDTALARLRELVTEGAFLAINPAVPADTWAQFTCRLSGALISFECETLWPLLEGADVAAIA